MYFTIIIPTRNRSQMLGTCLTSLLTSLETADDMEIIVVDNGSTDQTQDLVTDAAAEYSDRRIRYLYEPVPGAMAARHRGAFDARGEVCVFLDDDVSVGRHWINGLQEAFQHPGVILVGGPSIPRFEIPPPAWTNTFYTEDECGRSCGWLSLFNGGNQIREIDPNYIWSLNFAIRRKAFFDMGGFHPDLVPKALQRFQGDGETGLTMKMAKSGLKAIYHPDVMVRHHIPSSRLTAEYFEQRGFYQGVADSYSQIRAAGRAVPYSQVLHDASRPVRWFLDAMHAKSFEHYRIKRLTNTAYQSGFRFHLTNVRRDPNLLQWVLRKDYWDYALPSNPDTV